MYTKQDIYDSYSSDRNGSQAEPTLQLNEYSPKLRYTSEDLSVPSKFWEVVEIVKRLEIRKKKYNRKYKQDRSLSYFLRPFIEIPAVDFQRVVSYLPCERKRFECEWDDFLASPMVVPEGPTLHDVAHLIYTVQTKGSVFHKNEVWANYRRELRIFSRESFVSVQNELTIGPVSHQSIYDRLREKRYEYSLMSILPLIGLNGGGGGPRIIYLFGNIYNADRFLASLRAMGSLGVVFKSGDCVAVEFLDITQFHAHNIDGAFMKVHYTEMIRVDEGMPPVRFLNSMGVAFALPTFRTSYDVDVSSMIRQRFHASQWRYLHFFFSCHSTAPIIIKVSLYDYDQKMIGRLVSSTGDGSFRTPTYLCRVRTHPLIRVEVVSESTFFRLVVYARVEAESLPRVISRILL